MTENIFTDKSSAPEDSRLRKTLGASFSFLQEVIALTSGFSHEWKYYGANIGWQMKVTKKGKALLYLTPQADGFRIGLAVRDGERNALLASRLPATLRGELSAARRVSEGTPLRFTVRSTAQMKQLALIIGILLRTRG